MRWSRGVVEATKLVDGREDSFALLFRQGMPPVSLQLVYSPVLLEPPLSSSHNLLFNVLPSKEISLLSVAVDETSVPTSKREEEDERVVGEPGVGQGKEGREVGGRDAMRCCG